MRADRRDWDQSCAGGDKAFPEQHGGHGWLCRGNHRRDRQRVDDHGGWPGCRQRRRRYHDISLVELDYSKGELDYTKGLVWQQNADSFWWSKTAPSAAWRPAAGTATPHVSINVTNMATAAATTIDATKVHNETNYGATFSLSAPGVAKVTLGIAAEKLTFASMSSILLTAGSAAAIVLADGGMNTFTAGKGALDVTGGPGADS